MQNVVFDVLLVVDVQTTCTERQYEIPEWGLTLSKCRQKVQHIADYVNQCRQHGVTVIHVLTTEWVKEFLPTNIQRLYDENVDACFYHDGCPESVLDIQSNDIVLRKNKCSAFSGTDYYDIQGGGSSLATHLKMMQTCTVGVCGFYSTGCVNETIIEGFNREEIFWFIIGDLVETFDSERKQIGQRWLLEEYWPYMDGHVVRSCDMWWDM